MAAHHHSRIAASIAAVAFAVGCATEPQAAPTVESPPEPAATSTDDDSNADERVEDHPDPVTPDRPREAAGDSDLCAAVGDLLVFIDHQAGDTDDPVGFFDDASGIYIAIADAATHPHTLTDAQLLAASFATISTDLPAAGIDLNDEAAVEDWLIAAGHFDTIAPQFDLHGELGIADPDGDIVACILEAPTAPTGLQSPQADDRQQD